jgi:acyl carrier protein
MMDSTQVETMIRYVKEKVLRKPNADITAETQLVSSGIVDSFALVETLIELERVTNLRIPAIKVAPEDMDTVTKMLESAARLGKPRKH